MFLDPANPARRRLLQSLGAFSLSTLLPRPLRAAQARPAPQLSPGIRFDEIAKQSGLNFITRNSATPNKNQPETMVAGIALFDYDNDGWLDIYCVNGAEIPSLQKTSPDWWNRLYRNNHDGTFTDVTEKAGLQGSGYGMGVAVADYDNDGH
ncbi:MAG TPA: VCBS repeat-containing protein, partial [Terracidiphilus sp.]|nr:VCBS repeat-containing protein [Terracidiphilus sp.]